MPKDLAQKSSSLACLEERLLDHRGIDPSKELADIRDRE
jgi:hypothetical protein